MLEVEAKLRVASHAEVLARLAALGAPDAGTAVQDDAFLSHPVRDLAAADEALRVRFDGKGWELTYKGPRQAGAVKAREERNVACAQDPLPLLEPLGFRVAVRVRKRRRSFRLGEATVSLDDVEGLGTFVEVEALGDDRVAAEGKVWAALRALGLEGGAREERSYVEMLHGLRRA